jgi:hypothetical protein
LKVVFLESQSIDSSEVAFEIDDFEYMKIFVVGVQFVVVQ